MVIRINKPAEPIDANIGQLALVQLVEGWLAAKRVVEGGDEACIHGQSPLSRCCDAESLSRSFILVLGRNVKCPEVILKSCLAGTPDAVRSGASPPAKRHLKAPFITHSSAGDHLLPISVGGGLGAPPAPPFGSKPL
jgi:hypothetical protein